MRSHWSFIIPACAWALVACDISPTLPLGGDGSPGGAPPAGTCGDGVVDADEQCDDGNLDASDGCSAACRLESDPTGCPTPRTRCGDRCVNFQTDPANCGGCALACPAGLICSQGACVAEASCTGVTCPPGTACMNGACVGTCAPGMANCGDMCSDLATDPNNCGLCGAVCAAGESCVAGVCELTDRDCATNATCPAGMSCVNGLCRAPLCGDGLVSGTEQCDEGAANGLGLCTMDCRLVTTCAPGLVNCGGICIDLVSDPSNCGACGVFCAAGQVCAAGVCMLSNPTCAPGFINCGGICRNLATDPSNCGACGAVCVAGEDCAAGACTLADPSCAGVDCPAGEICASGTCRPESCGNGWVDAGEACDDGNNDPSDGCGADCQLELNY